MAFGLDNLGGATAANNLPANGTYIKGTSPGAAGGEQAHTLTIGEMPSHGHGVNDPTHAHNLSRGAFYGSAGTFFGGAPGGGGLNIYYQGNTTYAGTGVSIQANGGAPHNNVPPALMTNYIIKH